MAKTTLDVPLEAQQKNSTCWHASALMIWRYWQGITGRSGPMHSLGSKWSQNQTIDIPDFVELAKRVGMAEVPKSVFYSSDLLGDLLNKHGPLWCAGQWYGVGHIVVLTGVDDQKVFINDPDKAVRKQSSIAWFNSKLDNHVKGCLMCKDPKAY